MTNEIVKKEAQKILSKNEVTLQKSVSSSLLGKVKSRGRCILIDTSGSMNERIDNEQTKFSILINAIREIEGRRFWFSDDCAEVPEGREIPQPSYGTNLANAFRVMKSAGINHVVLVTDGKPDSEESALRESRDLKIDIIYIGPDPVPEFLKRLTNASSGTFENIKLLGKGSQILLGGKIKGLLG